MTKSPPLLEINNLKKYFEEESGIISRLFGEQHYVHAIDDVSMTLDRNEVIGVIGESGCGKTTLIQTLLGLTDPTDGEIRFKGKPISEFSRSDWKEFRRQVQIVFQNPFTALDPKLTVGQSLAEPLKVHNISDRQDRIRNALERAELRPPETYLNQKPPQLSGGEKQRVSIARALVLEPEIILADEPVSMLDVSTQASILNLLSRIKEETDMSMIYISHDLSTVSYVCDSIQVMYLGRIVERAPTADLIEEPKHPYSQALINAIPIPDSQSDRGRTEIPANAPDPIDLGEGCRFRDRCPERMDVCEKTPAMTQEKSSEVACHLYYNHDALEASEETHSEDGYMEVTDS